MQRRLLLAAATLSLTARIVRAQAAKPIRLIVPYPPGGPLDITARTLAEKVKDALGTVLVENRAGAGGNLGADLVAKAAPDGTTIGIGAVATHAINPWLYAKLPYDPLADFTPITRIAQVPNVLVMNVDVAAKLGITGVRELIDYAKRNPGKLNYGSGGNGSAGHLAGEMFKTRAGVFMVHIPYAGGNPAQLALLAGQVDLNFDNLASAAANIKAGKLRALALTTAKRSSAMPDLPPIADVLAGFDIDTWFGLFGPAGLPAETTRRLNRAFVDALRSTDVRARLAALMAEPSPTTPEEFTAFVRAELKKYEPLVKASGAKAD